MTPQDFQQQTGVSRETLDKLHLYAELLAKWQKKINLVGNKTIPDVWRRHILDSSQLMAFLPNPQITLVDLGSGAGFPAMVLAILGIKDVHVVDSDSRKMAFVREVSRQTETPITIHNGRIEALELGKIADVVSARACASLRQLCEMAEPLLKEDGFSLFLKGQNVDEELTEARNIWDIDCVSTPSHSDPAGRILQIRRMVRHHG